MARADLPQSLSRSAGRGAVLEAVQISRVFEMPAERVFGVRDVSLTVRQGDFVCLMGPSGCGKSTLLSLLAGLDVPTGGRVLFGGQDLSGTSAEDRAAVRLREIGMVFQDHQLIPEFTAVENVMLPLELQGQHHDEAEAAAGEALDRVGLKDLAHRFPSELSGGQRQRIGLARAIVGTRRAVLADEATGSLDHENSKMVFQLLRDLAAQGYAVLAATHDPLAAKFADRTLRMIDGSLSESEVTTVGEHER